MLTKIMWNIVIETNAKKEKNFSYCCIHARRVHCVYSNLLVAVEVGVFCLFLDKIRNNNFSEYDGLYLPVKRNIKSNALMIRPEGMYICAYIKGDWNRIPGFYQDILAYAKSHHIKLGTYAFETGMNDFAIETMEDYVTEISIHMED